MKCLLDSFQLSRIEEDGVSLGNVLGNEIGSHLNLENLRPVLARDEDAVLFGIVGDTIHDVYTTELCFGKNAGKIDPTGDRASFDVNSREEERAEHIRP